VIDAEDEAALSVLARQRSQTYWWLSELFLAAPDGAGIARLRERAAESSRSAEKFALKNRLGDLASSLRTASPEALAIEHARLFAGLGESYGPAPSFESIHAAVPAQGDTIPSMVEAYRAAGFDHIDVPAVPQDHLAVELRFMALLAAQESAARDGHDAEQVFALLGHQRRFLDDHLLAWVPTYCERIAGEAREPFFAAVARMTSEALSLDRENIDDLLRAAPSA
jgi:putative dimethyl sulfoxide reductase chaperone